MNIFVFPLHGSLWHHIKQLTWCYKINKKKLTWKSKLKFLVKYLTKFKLLK